MKILHLTFNDNSGAGRAVLRLNKGLQKMGVDSSVLVAGRYSGAGSVFEPTGLTKYYKKLQPLLVNAWLGRKAVKNSTFSINCTPSLILKEIRKVRPDLINLHWVGWDFLKIEDFKKLNLPLLWTLHDMWAFTGGCHVDNGCGNYVNRCGNCPCLSRPGRQDMSHKVWQRKKRAWRGLKMEIIAPSRWMMECASESSLFKGGSIHHLPNSVDTDIFKPMDKVQARDAFNLPRDKRLILIVVDAIPGAGHKGFHHFRDAVASLGRENDSAGTEVVVCGVDAPPLPADFALKSHCTGRLHDDTSLALLYSAADLFVTPSIQDNLPNTVMESLACGTPVAAFGIGGIPDMVTHKENGYLAKPFDADDLAHGIKWILDGPERAAALSSAAREKAVRDYSLPLQAEKYQALYRRLIAEGLKE